MKLSSADTASKENATPHRTVFDWKSFFASRTSQMKASEIRELLKLINRADIISFAGGLPDPALFPVEAIRAAYTSVLASDSLAKEALQYSVSEGYPPLREWIASYMTEHGAACSADDILITSGSQQALDFIGKIFLNPNDRVAVTAPTYLGALQALRAYQPEFSQITSAELAANGSLQQTAEGAPKLLYVMSDFANPSGECLSDAERLNIVGWAKANRTIIVEDGAYAELRYSGARQPSLLSIDVRDCGSIEASQTIYCGTLSKIIAPSLRIGWICAGKSLIERLVLVKQSADLHNPSVNQMVANTVLKSCFEQQIRLARELYGSKLRAMTQALKKYMPAEVTWTEPQGGMFVWLRLPAHIDEDALLVEAIEREGVAFVPGRAFFYGEANGRAIRLSFSLPDVDTIEKGIARLADVIRRHCK